MEEVHVKEWAQLLYERFISRYAVKICVMSGVTPNQVTAYNFVYTMVFGVWCFASGHYFAGLFVCLFNGLLDYIDGDLARVTGKKSSLGGWLDTGGDVIIQNSIMAAIAYSLLSGRGHGPIPAAVMLYFVGNAAMNLISFHYNATFGFSSHVGSELFRRYMDEKPHLLNRFLKNLIDPTASPVGMIFWTVRYWIVIGVFSGRMDIAFLIITALTTFKWIAMYVIYAWHLAGYKKLWILQALAIIDEDREEYHALRGRKKV